MGFSQTVGMTRYPFRALDVFVRSPPGTAALAKTERTKRQNVLFADADEPEHDCTLEAMSNFRRIAKVRMRVGIFLWQKR